MKRINVGRIYFCVFVCLILLFSYNSMTLADVIVDNGDPGTSSTGTWEYSKGSTPYGGDSLWARDGATYTWSMDLQPAGIYEVLMWWSGYPSRATSIPVAINHLSGQETFIIDQSVNAGQWNSFGEYEFDGSGSVVITAAYGSDSTCADAVTFRVVQTTDNLPPVASDDSGTTSEDSPIDIDVLFNDSDADGTLDAGTVTVVSHPSDGSAAANSDGTVTYIPNGGFVGSDSFTYTVQDNEGAVSNEATVTVTVESAAGVSDVVIDNGEPGTSSTGTWKVSSGPNPYGTESLWSRDGATYTWTFIPETSGYYDLFMWWTQWDSRSTNVPVDIEHAGGTSRVTINQQINGGQWNDLGQYLWAAGVNYSVTILAEGSYPTSYCADAVKFHFAQPAGDNLPPVANDDSGTTSEDSPIDIDVLFNDSDADGTLDAGTVTVVSHPSDGSAAANGDGTITYTPDGGFVGTDSFTYTVQDNEGAVSNEASVTVTVESATGVSDVVIDNGEPGTSSTGTWEVSSGPNPYGTESLWSRDGATYTWSFTPETSGHYDLFMWWTEWDSRSTNVPVDIEHAGGTSRVTINQQINGGQWNDLGQYFLAAEATYNVTIMAEDSYPTSYCADAVKFHFAQPAGDNLPPVANDDSGTTSEDSPIDIDVLFNDSDSDGTLDAGTVTVVSHPSDGSAAANSDGTVTYIPNGGFVGSDSFTYTVQDNEGAVSNEATVTVTVESAAGVSDVVIDNGEPGTSSTGTWKVSSGPNPYGTESLWSRDGATYTWTFIPDTSGYYDVFMWWTQWDSRSTSVPVRIEHADGTSTVSINQKIDGGKWNSIGLYSFQAGLEYDVTVTSQPYPASTCADAVKFVRVSSPPPAPEGEHIFACFGYATSDDAKPNMIAMLQDIGAYEQNGLWFYENPALNKSYVIHMIEDIEGMREALRTEDAHILFYGHSNYGLGSVFATPQEFTSQTINDVKYIDDERILNYSSPMIGVSIHGMREGQAYPNWWPIFQDGTSGIMPYGFDDPAGNPPYNYYINYQVPGDSTYYKMEKVNKGAIERFPGCDRPAWHASDGSPPDPMNPDHWQYFITLPDPWYSSSAWYPSFEVVGSWTESQAVEGYFHENYLYTAEGNGDQKAMWSFTIPETDRYKISAWWPASSYGTSTAPYTITHAFGSTTVHVDQRVNGGKWYELGTFDFNIGEYTVTLSNAVSSGQVVADAIRVEHVDNPVEVLEAHFNGRNRSGISPLRVVFDAENVGEVTSGEWDFGDGYTESIRDFTIHTYTEPGIYTISYTVNGPLGTDDMTKMDYVYVGDIAPTLQAEFSAGTEQEGRAPLEVVFEDRSSGDIVSWFWDFGDGGMSDQQNPTHTYFEPGLYEVSLTVTDINGESITEIKENFVRVVIFDETIDNIVYPERHYGSRTILFRREIEIPPEEMKYKRLLYISCTSGVYYTSTFQRGIMFYTVSSSYLGEVSMSAYLKAYLEGKSDEEIWATIQKIEPLYDYYNFNKLPSEQ